MRRDKHSLSHYKLLTCDMGHLCPTSVVEVLPGDTFQWRTSALIRVSPLVAPVMHPCVVRFHHWFVPNRIIWDAWEKFITGGPDGMDNTPIPTVSTTADPKANARLLDQMGVPPVANRTVNALPVYAFNRIYNEFYRDQDLQAERAPTDVTLPQVAWEKDYFTSARPWAQKGPEITLPIGDSAPVVPSGSATPTFTDGTWQGNLATGSGSPYAQLSSTPTTTAGLNWNQPALRADLSQATGITINEFRTAFALQRYQEARARFGSRFTEYLAYLGIRSSDARLQRPEYLGGGKQTISFSEVLQTADDTSNQNPLGRMGGHGIAALRSRRFRRFFEEHGYVISLMSVRPKTMYAEGTSRHWHKAVKEDYYQRELQHVGQQQLYNREVKFGHATPDGVFGWQDRYAEYKHVKSSVAREFRDTLDFWHLARKFTTDPVLNASFVQCNPSKRIHAAQANDVLWCMVNHSVQARRLVRRSPASRIV